MEVNKANIFYIFLIFSKTKKMHLLPFAKVGQKSISKTNAEKIFCFSSLNVF